MKNNEQSILDTIQDMVNKGELDTQRDIDIFLDVLGAFNRSANVALRITNMIDYCLKKRNDNLQMSFDEYVNTL